MGKSKIPYIDWVLNNITGCTAMSDGCANCYAKVMYERFDKSGLPFSDVRIDMNLFGKRLLEIKDKKQMVVGVNFMADTFHKDVTKKQIDDMLVMLNTVSQHQYIIFTKRYDRLVKYINEIDVPANVHFGISICNGNDLIKFHRIVINTPIKSKLIISFEPLIEKLGVDTNYPLTHTIREYCKWAIVGAESLGNKGGREYNEEWASQIKILCDKYYVPFYHKQQFIEGKKSHLLYGNEYLDNPLESK